MGVSINWLKKYVDFDLTPAELAHKLTMAGIAVEGMEENDDDSIMELDLTPNRGDCLGMINLAREVAAITGNELKIPYNNLSNEGGEVNDYIKIDIQDTDLCPRYSARVIKKAVIKPSPDWMQQALINSGIRPINNVVDITNYVMLETNQPLHAFDYNLLGEAKQILVRRAFPGEKIVTIDEALRELETDMLVITNGHKPVALAGVMGGHDSEINDNTTMVLLESANFNPVNIRRTSRKVALRSDSSMRFEKGVDPNGTVTALNRAAQLMVELADGQVVPGIVDIYPEPIKPANIELRTQKVNHLLDTNLSTEDIQGFMQKLSFPVTRKGDVLLVETPTYRPDLELEVDLIEEVARLYGYNNIPDYLPLTSATGGGLTAYQLFRDKLRSNLAQSMYEVINYSFINPDSFDRIMLPDDHILRQVVKVANPLSEEQSVMRTTLLPGLLSTVSRNMARRNYNLSFFELGAIFIPSNDMLPQEKPKVGGIVAGSNDINWQKVKTDMDYFYLKGILTSLFADLGILDVLYEAQSIPGYHPGRTALISCQGQELGVLGEIHPLVSENYDIKVRACAFELDIETMFNLARPNALMESITRYPAMERDIAVVLPEEVEASRAIAAIKKINSPLLRGAEIFDLFTGGNLPAGFKSMAFRLTFQSGDRTLKEEEINPLMEQVIQLLESELQARLR